MNSESGLYVNFPVSFLQNAFSDIRETMNYVFKYVTYKHAERLEYGDKMEQIEVAADYFNINFGDITSVESTYQYLQRKYNLKTPNVSININIVWDFYNNKKSEFDIACFCAFCAIKSILGNKEYGKTNKALIIARMFGESTSERYPRVFTSLNEGVRYLYQRYNYDIDTGTLSNAIKKGNLKARKENPNRPNYSIDRQDLDEWIFQSYPERLSINEQLKMKYSKRYHIDNVLTELQLHWRLRLYSDHTRGFYLSFKKELTDLAVIHEMAKRSNKKKGLTNEKRKAKEEAKKRLGL